MGHRARDTGQGAEHSTPQAAVPETVEKLPEAWCVSDAELERRRLVVRRIEELRRRLDEKYGEMPDSTPLVREDRSR